jgi:chromosomal replication initiation ATPase DnaA
MYSLGMAGRHIKDLIAAYRDRDDLLFRRAAQAIIDEEEAKRHTALAQDLRRLLASGSPLQMPQFEAPIPEPPKDRDSALPLADVYLPERHLADLVLSHDLFDNLTDLADEVSRWPTLDALGVPRRNRILLYGPPGCGKTSIAEALAGKLGRILVTVRVESVISSYLGETGANLRRVMDFSAKGAYVVLFDEFDSLAKDRDDPADHGELRRVVNAMLQLIDRYRGPSILIAATNHSQVIDDAMWRRFDEVLEVSLPDREQIAQLLFRLLKRRVEDIDLEAAVEGLVGFPHAAVEAVVYAATRRSVASGRTKITQEDLTAGLASVTARRWR